MNIISNAGLIGLGACVALFLLGCSIRNCTTSATSDAEALKILRLAQKFWWSSLTCLIIGIVVQLGFS